MFCSNCGKELDNDSKYCENCGSHIESNLKEETPVKKNESVTSSKTSQNNDRPISNTEAPQQKSESRSMGKRTFIVLGILILICGGLFYLISSMEKSESDNQKSPVETVVPPKQVSSVDGSEKHDRDQFDLLNSTLPVNDDIRQTWSDRYNLPTFTLKNGSFETGKANEPEGVIYEIDKKSIHYADLDGDGTKEVIFQGHYQWKGANGDPSEVVIGKINGSKLNIVEHKTGSILQNDYKKYYPNSALWERISFKLIDNRIIFFAEADGCHARADYIVKMPYILGKNGLELNGRPKRTKYK